MDSDPYADFADRYDLFLDQFGEHSEEKTEFYRSLFAENGVSSVLDCACGTGHDLVLFHSLGSDTVGSDVSDAMLAQARENLAERNIEVPLHAVDYRKLPQHFDRQFDAVVCLSHSILHVDIESEILRALSSMRGVLRDSGILVLDQGTTDRLWKEKPRLILLVNNQEFSRLFVIDYLERGARFNVIDIFHSPEIRDMKVWSTTYPLMLLRDDYERLIMAAGFREVNFYGSYNFEPYDKETSNRLIAVARK